MYYFVRLQVDTPVCNRRHPVESLIGLHGQHFSSFPQGIVPDRITDPESGVPDGSDQPFRIILRIADAHDHFIAKGQQGGERFPDGVIISDGIADE
jgi:hypothetical protein